MQTYYHKHDIIIINETIIIAHNNPRRIDKLAEYDVCRFEFQALAYIQIPSFSHFIHRELVTLVTFIHSQNKPLVAVTHLYAAIRVKMQIVL